MPPQSLSPCTANCMGWCNFGRNLSVRAMVSKGLITPMMQLLIGRRKKYFFLPNTIVQNAKRPHTENLDKTAIQEVNQDWNYRNTTQKIAQNRITVKCAPLSSSWHSPVIAVVRLLYCSYFLSNLCMMCCGYHYLYQSLSSGWRCI